MKRIFTTIICCLTFQLLLAQGWKVSLQVKQKYDEGLVYLCYHMGKNLNIVDSGILSPKSTIVFQRKDTLPGGIYSIVFPGKRQTADFFIDKEQSNISIIADTLDLVNIQVSGSPGNDLFQRYQNYIGIKGGQLQTARNFYNTARTKEDSARYEASYKSINKEMNEFRNKLIADNPESMMAVLLQAMKDPEVPNSNPKTRQDSLNNYYYYKAHYWDGVSFMDERIIRTPFFLPKLQRYYEDIIPQEPDSIIKDLDYKLLLARTCPEMYKFLLNWLTDQYISPKYMGQDAVFVHLFNKYHSKGLTPWLNEKQTEAVSRRAYMLMANLIGAKAADLDMVDSTGKTSRLYDVKADYTLVIFWDATCGHCKEEVPRIDSIYRASWKARNVRIYAVLSENDKKSEWVKYLKEHDLGDWTHVYETKEMEKAVADAKIPSFRQLYDVTSTPTIFLLDSEKRIIGKKLNWSQLNDLLQVKWGLKK